MTTGELAGECVNVPVTYEIMSEIDMTELQASC